MREEDAVFTADEESEILMPHLRESYEDAQKQIATLRSDVADLVHILQDKGISVPKR